MQMIKQPQHLVDNRDGFKVTVRRRKDLRDDLMLPELRIFKPFANDSGFSVSGFMHAMH